MPLIDENASAEKLISDGLDMMRRAYHLEIIALTQSIIEAIKDDEVTDSDSLSERMHEDVNGHQWIIYTHYNFVVLQVSENESAYVDDFGTDGLIRGGNIHWAGMAFSAMLADLRQQLEAEDVDLNGDNKDQLLGNRDDYMTLAERITEAQERGTARGKSAVTKEMLGNNAERCYHT